MNILTFDIEDWYHILDNKSTRTEAEWTGFESRIKKNTDRILEFLEKNKIRSTFFCLGWIAEKYPEIIRNIDKSGYEIASHSYFHQLIYEQSREEFIKDTERSVKTLEDLTGKKVTKYRAPGFSLNEKAVWVFEILSRFGIETDCSVFPGNRGHGGFPAFEYTKPCIIEYKGVRIKEFPQNTIKLAGRRVIFSGGGYFRLMPYSLIKLFSNRSDYIMTYFHPRDFDTGQQMIKDLSLIRKFKSYYGLRTAMKKLDKWVKDYDFIDLKTAETGFDWSEAKIVRLKD